MSVGQNERNQAACASAGVAWLAATTVQYSRLPLSATKRPALPRVSRGSQPLLYNTLGCPSHGVILDGGVNLGLRPRRRHFVLHEQAGALVQAHRWRWHVDFGDRVLLY